MKMLFCLLMLTLNFFSLAEARSNYIAPFIGAWVGNGNAYYWNFGEYSVKSVSTQFFETSVTSFEILQNMKVESEWTGEVNEHLLRFACDFVTEKDIACYVTDLVDGWQNVKEIQGTFEANNLEFIYEREPSSPPYYSHLKIKYTFTINENRSLSYTSVKSSNDSSGKDKTYEVCSATLKKN